MKHLERLELFAHTDEFQRAARHRLDGECRAAARIAVQLRHDDAIQTERGVECLGDVHGFLSCHGIHDEENLMRLYFRLDVAQLLHERLINLQTPCRINDDNIVGVGGRMCDCRTRNGDGVLLPLRKDGHIDLAANDLKLLDGSGTIDIVGNEQRTLALLFQHERELACRGRLT